MNSGNRVAVLWQRLESWAGRNSPEMLRDLNPGADDADIDVLEKAFGQPLPQSYRDSLKTHNGESDGWPYRVFADMGAYHSTESALNDYNMYLDITGRMPDFDEAELAAQIADDIITVEGSVQPLSFSTDWLPIMNCNGDVFWALDFAPASGGQRGQVIQIDMEGCYWGVVAPDFETFFEQYVSALEAGEYEVQEGLATKEPIDARELAIDKAVANSITRDELEKNEPGEVVRIVGCRSGKVKGDRCVMAIHGGEIQLRGSLRGSTFNQVLRVTIRVGKRRAFGLLAPIHDLLEWERVE
ncbi:MAG: SMI1/KNR4 family protein [Gammaproteobacteria bacterium]|nr:SMI1/KNR4 family protein [Gammaproteobacteria bacterium]